MANTTAKEINRLLLDSPVVVECLLWTTRGRMSDSSTSPAITGRATRRNGRIHSMVERVVWISAKKGSTSQQVLPNNKSAFQLSIQMALLWGLSPLVSISGNNTIGVARWFCVPAQVRSRLTEAPMLTAKSSTAVEETK